MDRAAGRSLWGRGAWSGACGLSDGGEIGFFAEPEFDFLELVAGEVATLPLVIVY